MLDLDLGESKDIATVLAAALGPLSQGHGQNEEDDAEDAAHQ